jgi:hypothetical protein
MSWNKPYGYGGDPVTTPFDLNQGNPWKPKPNTQTKRSLKDLQS